MKSTLNRQNLSFKYFMVFFSILFTISPTKADDASWSTDYLGITEANIQTFLNRHNGSLKNTNLCNTLNCDPYNYSAYIAGKTGWTRTELNNISGMSPARLIWLAAQENKINPVLLLAKLQAEQSLIEQSANQHTLDTAIGYRCNISTTTANCGSGFLAQITGFTYQFNSYYNHQGHTTFQDALNTYTPGINYQYFRQQYYDPYSSEMNSIAGINGSAGNTNINNNFSAKIDSFVANQTGVCRDMNGKNGCQCADLMYLYVQEVLGVPFSNQSAIRNNAYTIFQGIPSTGITLRNYDNADITLSKILNTPTNFPQKGDIIFWNTSINGSYGHVAIVVSADVNTFTSIDQNWVHPSSNGSAAALVTHSYSSVAGWLHPNNFTNAVTAAPSVKLALPSNGQTFNSSSTNVALSWEASSDATNYRVIVSTRQDFAGFTDNGGDSTCDSTCGTWPTTDSSTIFTTARPGSTYYWKVRANNSNLNVVSSWTAARSFSISASAGNSAEQKMNQCYTKYAYLFGSKIGGLIDWGSYIGQQTTGTSTAPGLNYIAINKNLSESYFWYYWYGWGNLDLSYCD